MKKLYVILIILILLSGNTFTQNLQPITGHHLSYKTQFFQLKESRNYGLVFSGLNLVFGYDYFKKNNNIFTYDTDISVGIDYRKGIGVNSHFKPFDFYFGYKINTDTIKTIYIGPYISANYHWQQYSELQSGHMFWFTCVDIGPKLFYSKSWNDKTFHIYFSNSVLGVASRPEPSTETHFYSLKFSDYIKNAHSNMEFGSLNLFNHTDLKIEMVNINKKGLSIAYKFQYFGYYENPEFDYLVHSINLKWKIGQKRVNTK